MAADWVAIVTPAISGLAGVGLGGLLQYKVARSQLDHGQAQSRRTERLDAYAAYVNYLRHIAIRFGQLLTADMRTALDEFMVESLSRRTSLSLLASDRVNAFLDERAEAVDAAFLEALASVMPAVEAKLTAGKLASPADTQEAVRMEIMKAWASTVKLFVRDLLQVMRADLKQ